MIVRFVHYSEVFVHNSEVKMYRVYMAVGRGQAVCPL